MKNLISIALIFCVMSFTACSSGTQLTLAEIEKLTPTEQSLITELRITGIEGDGELNLRQLLYNFKSLRYLELDKKFKGSLRGSLYETSPNLTEFIAKGVTAIQNGGFSYMQNLSKFECPNLEILDINVFSSDCYSITTLDFPNLKSIAGYSLAGCYNLNTLKLGSPDRITCYHNVFGKKISTEQIDLYLGKYEYENNVKGNQWTIHGAPGQDLVSFENTAATGEITVTKGTEDGPVLGVLTFRNIYPY